jgi:hypothetical protein
MTSRYLYKSTVLMVWVEIKPSGSSLERERLGGMVLWWKWGKFIRASFESSKGELWVVDQEKLPPGHSIMSLMVEWHSVSVGAMTRNMVSSMKPTEFLDLWRASEISGAL